MTWLRSSWKFLVLSITLVVTSAGVSAKDRSAHQSISGRYPAYMFLAVADAAKAKHDFDYVATALKKQAWLYLSAVIDAGDGSKWCVGKEDGEKVDLVLVEALRDRVTKSTALRKASAAPQIAHILSKQFPCSDSLVEYHREPRVSVGYLLDTANGLNLGGDFKGNVKVRSASHFDAYVSGVRDLSEGSSWCVIKSNIPPHEVNEMLLADIKTLINTMPEKKSTNASEAVSKILSNRFFCNK